MYFYFRKNVVLFYLYSCEAIIAMAHKLNLKVIGEGIETKSQHQLLAAINIDYCQGYLFSKPLPADQFEMLL